MNPPEPLPIAVAVVLSEGRVLIGRRPEGVPLAGLWEFPGGKVARGETPSEAAARECREETGLAVRVGDLDHEVIHSYSDGRLRIGFFLARPVDTAGAPRPPFRWVPLGELPSYSFPPANAAMIARLTGRPQNTT
jgi:8-oxo-dGTP diphosphatase